MKVNTILTINSIVALVFAAVFIFVPVFGLEMMGLNPGGEAPIYARGWGAFILGVSALAFFSRNLRRSEGRRAILLSLFFSYIFLAIYNIYQNFVAGIPINFMFVLLYLVHVGFAALYGYFLFGNPREVDV
jgi:hypothetical protein